MFRSQIKKNILKNNGLIFRGELGYGLYLTKHGAGIYEKKPIMESKEELKDYKEIGNKIIENYKNRLLFKCLFAIYSIPIIEASIYIYNDYNYIDPIQIGLLTSILTGSLYSLKISSIEKEKAKNHYEKLNAIKNSNLKKI